jgi:hypothetical protein
MLISKLNLTEGVLMKFFALFAVLLASSFSFASNGIVYENGNGIGYIHQGDTFQFKALGNVFFDSNNDYNDTAAFKLSFVGDVASFEDTKLYAGLGWWNDYATSDFSRYGSRYDAILGLRHIFASHWQVEIFANVLSVADGTQITTHYNANGNKVTVTGASGTYIGRTGGVALSYLF